MLWVSLVAYGSYGMIALVPKVEGLQLISQFCPISLCCTLYQVVTKLLVERLRPILTKIVGHSK